MRLLTTSQTCPPRRAFDAFTLVEMMIAAGVFALLIAAMVTTQLYGFRIYTLAQNRLQMTQDGRQTMDQIRDAIREAKTNYIGTCASGDPLSFAIAATLQSGNALKIFPNASNTPYTIYYLDTNSAPTNYFKSYNLSSSNTATTNLLAAYMTNTVIFYAEDYNGNVQTNNSDNRIIDVILQFNEYAYAAGSNTVRSAYQLRTRATQRTLH